MSFDEEKAAEKKGREIRERIAIRRAREAMEDSRAEGCAAPTFGEHLRRFEASLADELEAWV